MGTTSVIENFQSPSEQVTWKTSCSQSVNMSLPLVNPCKEIAPSIRVRGMSLRTRTHKELFAHVWPLLFHSPKHTGFPVDLTGWRWGWSVKHWLPKHWWCPCLGSCVSHTRFGVYIFCLYAAAGWELWWTINNTLCIFRRACDGGLIVCSCNSVLGVFRWYDFIHFECFFTQPCRRVRGGNNICEFWLKKGKKAALWIWRHLYTFSLLPLRGKRLRH